MNSKIIELKRDIVSGKDFVSSQKTIYKKGSRGEIIEKHDETLVIELDENEYEDNVILVNEKDVEYVAFFKN